MTMHYEKFLPMTYRAFLSGTPEQSESRMHSYSSQPSILTRVSDKYRDFRPEFDSTGLELEPRQWQG